MRDVRLSPAVRRFIAIIAVVALLSLLRFLRIQLAVTMPLPLNLELLGALLAGIYLGSTGIAAVALYWCGSLAGGLLTGDAWLLPAAYRTGLIAAAWIATRIAYAARLPRFMKILAPLLYVAPCAMALLADRADRFMPIYTVAVITLLLLAMWRMPDLREAMWLLLWAPIAQVAVGAPAWLMESHYPLPAALKFGFVFPFMISLLQLVIAARLRMHVPETLVREWLTPDSDHPV
ncbi:hypothetical protein JW905_10085 [bacterium]|nr:hypothetical protein [candidate division CSSED10-310 bacterium]